MQETCGERHDRLVDSVHNIELGMEEIQAEMRGIPDKIKIAILEANQEICKKITAPKPAPSVAEQPAVILSQKNVTTVGVIVLAILEIIKMLIGKV